MTNMETSLIENVEAIQAKFDDSTHTISVSLAEGDYVRFKERLERWTAGGFSIEEFFKLVQELSMFCYRQLRKLKEKRREKTTI